MSRVLAALAVYARPHMQTWRQFAGYIMFDAWVGNTDRHHENWGLVVSKDRKIELAPTFDHASSLGRELTDSEKEARLNTRDVRFAVPAFAAKARSAMYASSTDKKPLTNHAVFIDVAKASREGAYEWLGRLGAVRDSDIEEIFAKIPDHLISEVSRRFAIGLLNANRANLLALGRSVRV